MTAHRDNQTRCSLAAIQLRHTHSMLGHAFDMWRFKRFGNSFLTRVLVVIISLQSPRSVRHHSCKRRLSSYVLCSVATVAVLHSACEGIRLHAHIELLLRITLAV
jgi:hypothetical protein